MFGFIGASAGIILGLIMLIFPKISTKKANRESSQAVGKTRTTGLILMILSILLLATQIILYIKQT